MPGDDNSEAGDKNKPSPGSFRDLMNMRRVPIHVFLRQHYVKRDSVSAEVMKATDFTYFWAEAPSARLAAGCVPGLYHRPGSGKSLAPAIAAVVLVECHNNTSLCCTLALAALGIR